MIRVAVAVAGEGQLDLAVGRRLLSICGYDLDRQYDARGKGNLDKQIPGYNNAARLQPWLVLRDLDHDAECAPALIPRLLRTKAHSLILRIAVRSVESWLMADREALSRFLQVGIGHIPDQPELESQPKKKMVEIAMQSRRRTIIADMVPPRGLTSKVGRRYNLQLLRFVAGPWNPERASVRADSLRRCVAALRMLGTDPV